MKTAVATDTNSGISVSDGQRIGVYVLPMPVIINGIEYTEGVNISHADLYKALEKENVCTSQPGPSEVTGLWDKALREGAESVVYIPMSSGLSGACSAAQSLAGNYGGRVQVVDNHRISITQHSSVVDALLMAKKGADAKTIRMELERGAYDASIYISVGTVEYLKRSGRITSAGASLATVMNLHPILKIRGGKLDAQGVCRGEKHTKRQLIHLMERDIERRFSQVNQSRMRLGAAGTFIHQEEAQEWTGMVQEAFPDFEVFYHELSCSIACHVGTDSVAIAMAVKEGMG